MTRATKVSTGNSTAGKAVGKAGSEVLTGPVETAQERASREAREVSDRVKGLVRPDWLDVKHAKAGTFADIDAAVTYVKDATALIEDADRAVTYDAALLYWGVKEAGGIGKDCKYPNQQEFGTAIGWSKSKMSKLRVVAHGIFDHGIQPGTKAYTMLASHPGAAVTEAVMKGTDSTKVRQQLAGYLAETKANGGVTRSASLPPARTGTEEGKGGTEGANPDHDAESGPTPEPSKPLDTWQVLSATLDAFDAAMAAHDKAVPFTSESLDAVRTRVNLVLAREAQHVAHREPGTPKPEPVGHNAAQGGEGGPSGSPEGGRRSRPEPRVGRDPAAVTGSGLPARPDLARLVSGRLGGISSGPATRVRRA